MIDPANVAASAPASMPRKLFIVGVGRSGTSLLQAMLGSHGEIAFLPETGFVRRYLDAEASAEPASQASLAAFLERIAGDERVARWPLDADRLRAASEAVLADAASADTVARGWSAARCTFEAATRTVGAGSRYVGDKDPRNIERLERLAAAWPDCRIVHLVRDPRDVLLSRKKAAWSRDHRLARQLGACAVQFRLGLRAEPVLGPERLRRLRYEDLLADPEATLRDLCGWLDIAFEPAMLDFGATASSLVAADEMQWKAETLGPLLGDNSRKWASGLSRFEIATTERACTRAMACGGYPPDERPAPATAVALGRLIDLAARLWVARR